jgi:hypothetical protein
MSTPLPSIPVVGIDILPTQRVVHFRSKREWRKEFIDSLRMDHFHGSVPRAPALWSGPVYENNTGPHDGLKISNYLEIDSCFGTDQELNRSGRRYPRTVSADTEGRRRHHYPPGRQMSIPAQSWFIRELAGFCDGTCMPSQRLNLPQGTSLADTRRA